MNWLRRIPGSRRAPAGLEWTLFRRLPVIAVAGTVAAALFALGARFVPPAGEPAEVAKHLQVLDAYVIGALILHWTIVLTVAIGCVIVMVMKGPGYQADGYPLPDRDRPIGD